MQNWLEQTNYAIYGKQWNMQIQLENAFQNLPPFVDEIYTDTNYFQNQSKRQNEIQTIMLFVNIHQNGQEDTIPLICKNNSTIESIKKQIINTQEKIILYHNSNICFDKLTLKENLISNNAILEAWIGEEVEIVVFVKLQLYASFINKQVRINRNKPFNVFMDGIYQQIFCQRINEVFQEISIQFNNQNLSQEDNRTLDEIGITNGCVLNLIMHDKKGCFPPTTLIRMSDDQNKRIGDVKIGDYIMSYDFQSQKQKSSKVVGLHISKIKILSYIKTEKQEVTATLNNPVFTSENWKAINPNLKFVQKGTDHEGQNIKHRKLISQNYFNRNKRISRLLDSVQYYHRISLQFLCK